MTRARVVTIAFLVAVATLVAGCGVQVTDLPLPGTRVSGSSRELRLEFSNVLNLPARSKVLMNGTKVGVLREVGIGGTPASPVAVATVDMQGSVRVPQGTRASLEQSTLLGDIYIALTPPADSDADNGSATRALGDGATIPVSRTTVTPAVEELLGGIASLANGGTLEKIQRTVDKANTAFPDDIAQRDKAIEVSRELVARLAQNRGPVGEILDSLAVLARSVQSRGKDLGFTLDVGPERIGGALVSFASFSKVLASLGFELVPVDQLFTTRAQPLSTLIRTVDPLVDLAVELDSTLPRDLQALGDLVNKQIIPFLTQPSVNMVDITSPTGLSTPPASSDELRTVAATMRMIGAMR
ncbi:MlaD family protein [Williamsia deligens]|uniref:MlaD family protein n=1 Tax=Williamsia deligens TaxID=321325 RepID=A0ABW3G843_9NOCA|nr:MlaD family protein [Williamsia deligens]MCP2192599.1 phospholipid/cholesterol/gamma-HCH transport system substrate-binding protein [Williamsia deligens]